MFNNLLYLNLVSRMSEWSIVISSMHLTSLKQQQSLAYRHVYTWSIASSFVSHPSLLQLQHLPSFLASTFAPMMFLWLDSCCNFLLSFSSFLWLCFSFPVLLLCLCYLPLSIVTSPFKLNVVHLLPKTVGAYAHLWILCRRTCSDMGRRKNINFGNLNFFAPLGRSI